MATRLVSGLRHSAAGGVAVLVSGSTVGQAIALAATPVLAHFYSPQAFGVFAYIVTICAVLAPIATLRYEAAIPLARSLAVAQSLTRSSIVISTGFSALVALLVAIFQDEISERAGFAMLPWAWWLPVLLMLTCWFNTLSQAALRQRSYRAIAGRTLVQSIGTAGGQIACAIVTRSAGGLLTGQLLGRSFGIAALGRTSKELLRAPGKGVTWKSLVAYWRFPSVFAPSALLNTLGTNLPLIVIGVWFSPHAAGLLAIAQRIAIAPTSLVSVAVGQVFSGELSRRFRDGITDNRRLYLRTSGRLLIGGLLIAAAFLIGSDLLFSVLLGDEWDGTAEFSQALAVSVGVGFVVSPVSFVFLAYQRVRSNFAIDVSRLVLVAGLGAVAYVSGATALETVWAMYTGQVVNYALTWVVGLAISHGKKGRTGGTEVGIPSGT